MKRTIVNFTWEHPEAQNVFARWGGFPDEQTSSLEADRIEDLLQITPSAHILDVGCGTDRHSLELAKRGYHVVGIDIAESYLKLAQEKAAQQHLSVEFRLQRGSELQEEDTFDAIFAYYHTLGFLTDEELRIHVQHIWHALKSDHLFLLVLAGPSVTTLLCSVRSILRMDIA